MDSFFIPPVAGSDGEGIYQRLRTQTELQMGRAPSKRRIQELWTRRGGVDCVTTVGEPDPIRGDLVIAIFDMGPRKPFVIFCHDPAVPDTTACEILGASAYSVSEFAV